MDQESEFLKTFYDIKSDPNIVNPLSNEIDSMFQSSAGYQVADLKAPENVADLTDNNTSSSKKDYNDWQATLDEKPSSANLSWYQKLFTFGWLFFVLLAVFLILILWLFSRIWLKLFDADNTQRSNKTAKVDDDYDPKSQLQLANFALAAGESKKAKKIFEDIIDQQPSYFEAYRGLLKISGDLRDNNKFEKILTQAKRELAQEPTKLSKLSLMSEFYFPKDYKSDVEGLDQSNALSEKESLVERSFVDENLTEKSDSKEGYKESDVSDVIAKEDLGIDSSLKSTKSETVHLDEPSHTTFDQQESQSASFDPFVESVTSKYISQATRNYDTQILGDQKSDGLTREGSANSTSAPDARQKTYQHSANAATDSALNLTGLQDVGYVNETRLELAEYMLNSGNVIAAKVLLRKVYDSGDGKKVVEVQNLLKKYTADIDLN